MNEYEQIAAELTELLLLEDVVAICKVHASDKGALLHINALMSARPRCHMTVLIDDKFLKEKEVYIAHLCSEILANLTSLSLIQGRSEVYFTPMQLSIGNEDNLKNPDATITLTAE